MACQSLGALEKGGAVVGIDLKVAYMNLLRFSVDIYENADEKMD